jgi:hypothetical protein
VAGSQVSLHGQITGTHWSFWHTWHGPHTTGMQAPLSHLSQTPQAIDPVHVPVAASHVSHGPHFAPQAPVVGSQG